LDFDLPEKVKEFMETYADRQKIFDSIMANKLEGFYMDLGWSYNLNKNTGSVDLRFIDEHAKLQQLTWNIYDDNDLSLFATQTTVTPGTQNLTITGLDSDKSYSTEIILSHPYYGDAPVRERRLLWLAKATLFPGFPGIDIDDPDVERTAGFIKFIIAIITVLAVLLVFSQYSSEVGVTISMSFTALFLLAGWFDFVLGTVVPSWIIGVILLVSWLFLILNKKGRKLGG
jgi:hypothetical protein